MGRRRVRDFFLVAILSLNLVATYAHAGAKEVEKHLREEYSSKMVVLRGFYSGDRLRYDTSGAPALGSDPGDWMSHGFLQINEIHLSHHRLMVEGRRLLVIERDEKQFQSLQEDERDRRKFQIEAALDAETPDIADKVMSKIFLTAHDDLATLVPDYWKPCVRAATMQQKSFSFSPDLLAVPGVAPFGDSVATPPAEGGNDSVGCRARATNRRRGVGFPRATYIPEPEFSERARQARFQGVVLLKLVVNEKGLPENVRIIRPLGMGLDEKALECVRKWRFNPAEKDGEPVAEEIAVEVNFHLY